MDKIFKAGDKVYCILHGWGEVIYADYDDDFGIHVRFGIWEEESFTNDGRFYLGETPILSFTEYTLEGFSQERPKKLPKIGDIVWVRDGDYQAWRMKYFCGMHNKYFKASSIYNDPTSPSWNEMTTENPFKNEQ